MVPWLDVRRRAYAAPLVLRIDQDAVLTPHPVAPVQDRLVLGAFPSLVEVAPFSSYRPREGADGEQLCAHLVISSTALACALQIQQANNQDFPTLPFLTTKPRPCGGVLWVYGRNRVGGTIPAASDGARYPFLAVASRSKRGGDPWPRATA